MPDLISRLRQVLNRNPSGETICHMTSPDASLWRSVPADIAAKIDRCLSRGCENRRAGHPATVFFRADDVAVPGRRFGRLLMLFSSLRIPLSLAVVPAWLTEARWRRIQGFGDRTPDLWCWHQHGWRHANYEKEGKKQEFGPSRSASRIKRDLARGKERLESLMDRHFYPVFTPPWNRCSQDTLRLLREMNYRGVSRSAGSLPAPPEGLPDFQVNVDLHTRRDPGLRSGWSRLLSDLEAGVESGACGIMIHHQLMTDPAFEFLELLGARVAAHKGLLATDFRRMAGGGE